MKRIKTILIVFVMMVSFVFIGDAIGSNGTSGVSAQDKVYYKTKRGTKRVYRKGRWVTVTTWKHGKRITKKVWRKGNSIGHKTARGTKRVFVKAGSKLP